MIRPYHKVWQTAAALAVVGSLAMAQSALAADKPAAANADPVEAQITRLHDELHITDAQSGQFEAVAQVMRDNRNAHDALVKDLRQNDQNVSAVQDLQNYAQIAQNHADGVKKLATAFETLYGVLSDDQKKAADEAFREHKRRTMQHMQHMTKKSQ